LHDSHRKKDPLGIQGDVAKAQRCLTKAEYENLVYNKDISKISSHKNIIKYRKQKNGI